MDDLLNLPCYDLLQTEKEQKILSVLNDLTRWHYKRCRSYRSILDMYGGLQEYKSLASIPYVAVSLFKHFDLLSISQPEIFKVLTSSGTTSQTPSKIYLDRSTATQQSKVLVKILQHYIGKQRLPMMLIDHAEHFTDRSEFSARGAGIQGLSIFGRNHRYVLDKDMNLNTDALIEFCDRYKNEQVLLFGFTFMVWDRLLTELKKRDHRVSLPRGILIHSGGWKKMHDKAVDNTTFKETVRYRLGIERVYNFYGMVEQTGSVFMECKEGFLHAPVYSDIIVRNTVDLRECEYGEEGIIQVLSMLPKSYPGHSLMTEDLGVIIGADNCKCGRKGKYFLVNGRLPSAEARGCSDTFKGAI